MMNESMNSSDVERTSLLSDSPQRLSSRNLILQRRNFLCKVAIYIRNIACFFLYLNILLFGIVGNEWSTTSIHTHIIDDFRSSHQLAYIHAENAKKEKEWRNEMILKQREQRKKQQEKKILESKKQYTLMNTTTSTVILTNQTNLTVPSKVINMKRTTMMRKKPPNQKSKTNQTNNDPFFPLFIIFGMFAMIRSCTYICIRLLLTEDEQEADRNMIDEAASRNNISTIGSFFSSNRSSSSPFLRRRRGNRSSSTQTRRARYNALVERLNRTRVENGEQPISAESLRLVLSTRDFTGDDYEHLLRFNEENGPAMNAFLSSLGATTQEIERNPTFCVGEQHVDLLNKYCAICLEGYEVGQEVRTIPCFHTFHKGCIDTWLRMKAECPICKFPALG